MGTFVKGPAFWGKGWETGLLASSYSGTERVFDIDLRRTLTYPAVTLFELTVVNNWYIIMVSSAPCPPPLPPSSLRAQDVGPFIML